MKKITTWYIRSEPKGDIKGPFPGGQISQEILLGRYKISDVVSHDKDNWFTISDIPELIPEIYKKDRNDPDFNDRLAAAHRWADERRGVDKMESDDERRAGVSYESIEIRRLHRLANAAKKKNSSLATFAQASGVLVIIISVIVLAFQNSPKDIATVDCSAPASQGVDWHDCNLSGLPLLRSKLNGANLMNTNLQTANLYASDLSHANLKYTQLHLANLKYVTFTKANLKGANLLGADLSGAIMNQADLRFANLRDAIIKDTNFENARLDNAIWIDGRICKTNSIGSCN